MSRLIRRVFDSSAVLDRRSRRGKRRATDLNARLLVSALEERSVPATFTVTTAADSGTGSLRDAITQANATGAADTIQFSNSTAGGAIDFTSGPHTISLLTALPAIVNPVTITGPGSGLLTVQRSTGGSIPNFRIFTISSAASSFSATISGVTITGGLTAGSNRASANGGGVSVGGLQNVTLQSDVVTGNTAAGSGGGVEVDTGGQLTVVSSTVSGNTAGGGTAPYGNQTGGGIYFAAGGSLTLDSSTVSGNFSPVEGGGVYMYGGAGTSGAWTIKNSTISGNTSLNGGGVYFYVPSGVSTLAIQSSTIAFNTATAGGSGGGIAQNGPGGTITLTSTIVADNVAPAGAAADVQTDPTTAMVAKYSLIKNQTLDGTTAANLTLDSTDLAAGTDPLLNPLGSNGGPTQTQSLQATSPAIDHGSNPTGVMFDQRGAGFPRSVGQPDIGAYEYLPPGTPVASGTFANVTSSLPVNYSFSVTYTATAAGATINAAGNINTGDILVTGPNSYSQVATFDSVSPGGSATVQTATYHVTAPNTVTGWAVSDYGAYTIMVQDSQVVDSQGHNVPAGIVGSFQVLVPATFTVTNTLDDGSTGSLRWAVAQANALAGAAVTINFNTNPGLGTNFSTPQTISLTSGTALTISNTTTIDASSVANVTITGVNATRVFSITSGTPAVTLNNLTVTGGFLSAAFGAGIFDNGLSLTVLNSVISANTIGGSGGSGPGIFVGSNDSLTVRNSTLSGNSTVGVGGAIYFSSGGSLLLDSSTVSGNTAGSANGAGGGVSFTGAASAGGVTIRNSTITGNSAASGGGVALRYFTGTALIQDSTITANTASAVVNGPNISGGGGIAKFFGQTSGTVVLQNTIVAGNVTSVYLLRRDIASDTPNSITATNSLIGDVNQAVQLNPASANNLTGTDAAPLSAQLGALANNGGPTQTMLPQAGSPAINHGVAISGITTDQTGAPRSVGLAPDIGAVETSDTSPVATAGPLPDVTSTATSATYQFTITYSSTANINTGTIGAANVTITPPTGVFAPLVSLVGVNSSNPMAVVATYQFTAPGSAWTYADNGAYTITSNAGQVTDTNGASASANRVVGSFQARVPITVTNTNDTTNTSDPGYVGSLRWAIGIANTVANTADTILFSNSTAGGATNFYDGTQHTITLSGTQLFISDSVTITGPGSSVLTISGNNASRVFAMSGPGILNIALSGMTITGGDGLSPSAGVGGAIAIADENLTLTDTRVTGNSTSLQGGGIGIVYPYASLTLHNSTVSGNSAGGTGGGGIYFFLGGSLLLDSSTISGNTVAGGEGGGIYFYGGHSVGTFLTSGLTVRDSTISGNSAATNGGGIMLNDTIGTFTIQNSTIAFNSAGSAGGGLSATPAGQGGSVTVALTSSIVAKNTDNGTGPDFSLMNHANTGGNVLGSVRSDHSLIGVGDTGFSLVDLGGTLKGTEVSPLDPKLAPLANNGGLTQTHALLPGSPAIDAGDNPVPLTTDQRGFARVSGAAADMGSYEVQPMTVAAVQVGDGSAQRSEVRSITVTFSGPVTFAGSGSINANAAAAFQLQHFQDSTNINNLAAAVTSNALNQTIVTLTFTTTGNSANEIDPISATGGVSPSLADGRFQLTIFSADVSGPDGLALDGDGNGTAGGNYVSPTDTLGGGAGQLHLYRLFGDATGNGVVDALDLGQFRTAYNTGVGNPLYLAYLDADNSGFIDSQDLGQFRTRYNLRVFP